MARIVEEKEAVENEQPGTPAVQPLPPEIRRQRDIIMESIKAEKENK